MAYVLEDHLRLEGPSVPQAPDASHLGAFKRDVLTMAHTCRDACICVYILYIYIYIYICAHNHLLAGFPQVRASATVTELQPFETCCWQDQLLEGPTLIQALLMWVMPGCCSQLSLSLVSLRWSRIVPYAYATFQSSAIWGNYPEFQTTLRRSD